MERPNMRNDLECRPRVRARPLALSREPIGMHEFAGEKPGMPPRARYGFVVNEGLMVERRAGYNRINSA